jgi:hypothetical protein
MVSTLRGELAELTATANARVVAFDRAEAELLRRARRAAR